MGCWETSEIVTDCGVLYGFIEDGFPGCGKCNDCAYEHKYTSEQMVEVQEQAQAWREKNNKKFAVLFTSNNGKTGSFELRATSLKHAQEIVDKSLFDCKNIEIWTK